MLGAILFYAYAQLFQPLPLLVVTADELKEDLDMLAWRLAKVPSKLELNPIINQHVDNKILHQQAIKHGFDNSQVVVQRLLNLVKYLQPDESINKTDAQLLTVGRNLGLLETDSLITRYMTEAMRQKLLATATITQPTAAQIAEYYQANIEDYGVPVKLKYSHVYIGGLDKAAQQKVAALAEKIRPQALSTAQAVRMGDVFYGGHEYGWQSLKQIEKNMGSGFAEAIAHVEPAAWSAPLSSAYGWHLVFISDKKEAGTRPLAQVEKAIVDILIQRQRKEWLDSYMAQQRSQYQIVVEDITGVDGVNVDGMNVDGMNVDGMSNEAS